MLVRSTLKETLSKLIESDAADWLKPTEEQEGLQRYVETIRERFLLILLITLITTGAACAYVFTATKTYEAQSNLIITPIVVGDSVSTSLGLIQASSDPTRDVETASQLVTNIDVATRVKEKLGLSATPESLLAQVIAQPVAQSNFVAVTATENSPPASRDLANAFAEQAVALRTELMHRQINEQLPRLEVAAKSQTGDQSTAISDQIAQLKLLQTASDPTMRVQSLATLPTTQASPRPALSIAAGLVTGLILGIIAAFASQALDPKLRRESQLRRLYSLPILGRIPIENRKTGSTPLDPKSISPVTAEAFRTIRTTLTSAAAGRPGGRVVFITGSSPSEGKTSSAINIATSLALSGKRVVLIESDLRRPVLGRTLGANPSTGGVVSVLLENTTLAESLTQVRTYGPNLQLLLADYEGGWIAELFSIPMAEQMIEDARDMADFVIVDSPPLNEVVDALPLARHADDVLIVVRLGTTRLDKINQLGELLAENSIRPAGFTVVGTPRPKRGEYHYYAASADRVSTR